MIRSLLVFLLFSVTSTELSGAAGRGQVVQEVVRNLTIQSISDLNFGVASPGDGAKTVNPGLSEDGENGSFLINGEPGASFRIVLPPNGTVKMHSGNSNAPHKTIDVNDFQSFPSHTGIIDSQGEQRLFIGATRDALSTNQESGHYKGYYIVTVVY